MPVAHQAETEVTMETMDPRGCQDLSDVTGIFSTSDALDDQSNSETLEDRPTGFFTDERYTSDAMLCSTYKSLLIQPAKAISRDTCVLYEFNALQQACFDGCPLYQIFWEDIIWLEDPENLTLEDFITFGMNGPNETVPKDIGLRIGGRVDRVRVQLSVPPAFSYGPAAQVWHRTWKSDSAQFVPVTSQPQIVILEALLACSTLQNGYRFTSPITPVVAACRAQMFTLPDSWSSMGQEFDWSNGRRSTKGTEWTIWP
jgi:hypothetical protein